MPLSKVNNFHKESCCLAQGYCSNIMDVNIAELLYGPDLEWTPINQFLKRKRMEKLFRKLERRMLWCFYCNNCEVCEAFKIRRTEFKRMGFWTQ